MTTDSSRESRQRTTWAFAVATFFGAGNMKPAPGTWGSIGAVLVWAVAAWALPHNSFALTAFLIVGIIVSVAIGIPAATIAARESGRHDPGFIVIDEVAGQWIALLGCPRDWAHALIALILFRLFDITKPFPARQLERLPDGWGIVFDDVAAGLYAFAIAALVRIWY